VSGLKAYVKPGELIFDFTLNEGGPIFASTAAFHSDTFYAPKPTVQAPTLTVQASPTTPYHQICGTYGPAADATPVHVAGVDTTIGHLRSAIAVLTAAPGNRVARPLAAVDHPLAQADLRTIASIQRAYDAGTTGYRTAVLRHFIGIVDGRPGPFTYDDAGFAVPPQTIKQIPLFVDGARAVAINIIKTIGNGRVVGRGIRKMPCERIHEWLRHWTLGDLRAAYDIEAEYCKKPHPAHPGAHPTTARIVWAPAVNGEIPVGLIPDGDWPSPEDGWPDSQINNYLLAARCAYPRYLTWSERGTWVRAHLSGNKITTDRLSRRAKERAATGGSQSPPLHFEQASTDGGWQDLFDREVYPRRWNITALRRYLTDHNQPCPPYWHALVRAVTRHADQARVRLLEEASRLQLTYAPEQPNLTGFHRKSILIDQHGQRWLFKPAPGPDARFRADTEHEAHVLARLWGYRTAESHLVDHDGQYGQIQAALPVERSLLGVTGAAFAELTRAQLTAIAKEHLLDWALDNDDTHGDNIVLCTDGTAIGIDKGRAWRYFGGWDGLSATTTANTNAQLIYTDLYAAIAAHHLDRDLVEAMYRAVIVQAHRMQRLPDDIMAAAIRRAVAHRPHFKPSWYQNQIDTAPTTADELIEQAVARKNNLVADMQLLWSRIYTAAGWEPPVYSTPLGTNPQGHVLHAGLHSPELHDAITQTKSYGTAAFVAGDHIEDAHILLWRERRANGKFNYRGHFKIRAGAFAAVSHWCFNQTHTPPVTNVELPGERECYDAIIAAAKTISFHWEDQQFNEDKLSRLESTRLRLAAQWLEAKQALAHEKIDHGKRHQLTAIIAMAGTYLDYIGRLDKHKADHTRSTAGDFPQFTYYPPPPEPQPGKSTYTVKKVSASRASASSENVPRFDPDGELRLNDGTLTEVCCGQLGSMYLITLDTGEQIEFRSGEHTNTPSALHGMTQFTIPEENDLDTALHRIEDQLRQMGCPIAPATPRDLELFYWRHLAGIMDGRADSHPQGSDPRYRAFWTHVHREAPDENAMWRTAFATLTSPEQIQSFIAEGGHLPHFSHLDLRLPHQPCGKPHWYRFDVPPAVYNAVDMPTVAYRTDPVHVVATGAAMSTETRLRTLAIWKCGQSSGDDMVRGSSHFVFGRLNRSWQREVTLYLNRRVLARTSTYSYNEDFFGALSHRREHAAFAFNVLSGRVNDANEVMIKEAVSLLDDIEICYFADKVRYDTAIAHLESLGITEIRGVPVTTRILNSKSGAALDAAKKAVSANTVTLPG
jgi:hypothetical protein